jgi:hypothetical protein
LLPDAATTPWGTFAMSLQFEPLDYSENLWLSRVLCTVERYDEARGAAARAGAAGGDARALAALGCAEACAGNAEAADEVASQLRKAAQTHYVPRSAIAGIEIAQGRLDRASVEIGIAIQQGDATLKWSKIDRRWAPLRGWVPGL